jgi:LysM repeat protein
MAPDPVRPHRSPARLLAPAALAAALLALGITVTGESPAPDEVTAAPAAARPPGATRTYVVRPGDTISVIAERHRTTGEAVASLNPGLDPQAVQPGTRLRLAR